MNERQLICTRRKCRNAFRANRARFISTRYETPADVIDPNTNAHSTGLKSALAWRVVAGPAVSAANLQPPDPETAARMARADAEFRKWLHQVEQTEAEANGEFTNPEWREVVSPDGVACYVTRFASIVDFIPIELTVTGTGIELAGGRNDRPDLEIPDDLSIPAFLRRGRTVDDEIDKFTGFPADPTAAAKFDEFHPFPADPTAEFDKSSVPADATAAAKEADAVPGADLQSTVA